jgi:hypothetical protein
LAGHFFAASTQDEPFGSFGFSPPFEFLWRHYDEDHGEDQDEDGGAYQGCRPNGGIKKRMGNVPHRDRDGRRPNGNQKVYDFGDHPTMRPAKSKLRVVLSGTGDLSLVISCQ